MKGLLFLLLSISTLAYSQENNTKVEWSDAISWKNDSIVEVHVIAEIDEHWHIYGMDLGDELGPIPTSIIFNQNDSLLLKDAIHREKPITSFDESFGIEVTYYEGRVVFTQTFVFKGDTTLKYGVEYMACDNSQCLPPEFIEKSIVIKKL